MSACPRGSCISAVRSQSQCARTQARLSSIDAPAGVGNPSVTSRRGSPAAWASMVRIRWIAMPRNRAQATGFDSNWELSGSGTGIRTPVPWLRTTYPNP